ncbi:MAG: hypothetical protein OXC47_02795, partial [Cyanobacteria bacterium MAG APA_bin_95]|nr:hypothetical protein [Cyanobacteria bacterium MAG APA_bin_95]
MAASAAPSPPSDSGAQPGDAWSAGPELAVRSQELDKIFSNGFQALRKVDLAVGKGEVVVIMGPS